jgi:ABC-type Fe3+/spermidine/putrescine transport system ATPase subunit
METPVLEFRDVTKRFASHTAVDGISLAVGKGAFFSLLGPSGCGKTTTLRLAAGFEQPDSGDVLLSGVRINHLRPYERNVSTVFQNYALFPHLSVRGNIEFGLRRKRASAIEEAVRSVIELVQLAGKESRKPSEISGGERQRVALARSLVLAPDVLLLDEPLSALDPNLRKQMRAELKAVQRRVGVTFLFVTHDQEEALSLSDRIAVMNDGRIEQTGSPQDLYLRPGTRFVAGFLGAMNWYNGIGIRPESTCVGRIPPGNGTSALRARVGEAVFLGNCLHIETTLASGERIVSEIPRTSEAYAAGDEVYVWWRPEDEVRFPLGDK